MRQLITILTVILLLITVRGLYWLIPSIGSTGNASIFIPTAAVFVLSSMGLYLWHKRAKFATSFLLGAWFISVAFGIAVSWNNNFISLQTLLGIPAIAMLAYTMWKDHSNDTST